MFGHSLSLFSVAVINTVTESNLGEERVYETYTSTSQSITEGSLGKNSLGNLEAVTEAEDMEEHYLLACSSWLVLRTGVPAQGCHCS